jgi:LDH2 family malate/lactate/ureidoglycolate dehydrogenase
MRHDAAALVDFATALLARAGLAASRARTIAEVLVEGDLLGHDTHGLALLPPYLKEIEAGSMTLAGEPETVSDRGAAVCWDGRRLPGVWLTVEAIELAMARAAVHGTGTVVIRQSHHIACLAAYLRRVTERDMVLLLTCSDPSVASVAPFGGRQRLYTPNPIAAGIPTNGDPILLDVSMSITTNGLTGRLSGEGRLLAHDWLIDGEGNPSRDPKALFADPPGSILPLGGLDHGHKGFALGLLVEVLTSSLGGFGRAERPSGWGASVLVQVIDPAAFGGRDAFLRETSFLADAVHANPPRPGVDAVRLPGERGLRRREQQLRDGVALYPSIMPALLPWSEKLGVALPGSA